VFTSPQSRSVRQGALLLAAWALLVAGCGDDRAARVRPEAGTAAAKAVDAACRPDEVQTGAPPRWTAAAALPTEMPFALARGEQLAAFFFTHPLHVTRVREHNKVQWVLARPTGGEPLEITATRPRTGTVRAKTDPGLGGNGQIQRSALDFPAPGCWRLTLRWGAERATRDVNVVR
jgi:hypothetical protein